MTRRARAGRALALLGGVAALALALAACSGGARETPGQNSGPSAPAGQGQDGAGGGETSEPVGDPACETIIPSEVVAEFEKVGWSAEPEEFRVGGTVVPGGVQCVWGDYSVASDHVQIYGWAPLDEAQAASLEEELETQGWIREEDGGIVYLTEDPDFAITTDDEGYGMTYAFGDGWVSLADTKQGIVLVSWPPA